MRLDFVHFLRFWFAIFKPSSWAAESITLNFEVCVAPGTREVSTSSERTIEARLPPRVNRLLSEVVVLRVPKS